MSTPATEPSTSPLARFIWGEEKLQQRQEVLKDITQDPILSANVNLAALSRRDHWAVRVQQAKALVELYFKNGWTSEHFLAGNQLLGDVPSLPQFRIFLRNLKAQMSPEQQAYWVPRAERFEILGCYAQTEVGHGSNLGGIETRATFDPETDEFILESPTVSSSKMWIGSLGAWATHAIVVAKLIVSRKEYGNHLFMVQVRDLNTHDVLPGITIYEQRDKTLSTTRGLDHGVMRFFCHRIPRSHMFAGSSSLSHDGTYNAARNKNHSYTSMIIIRGLLSSELAFEAMKCLYIAAYYLAFRRQFGVKGPGQKETAVINYASVKGRLFTAIARETAIILNGRQITAAINQGIGGDLNNLHIMTVGGKVYASEHGARDTEAARILCGGHGHHESAGFGYSYSLVSAARTYEGDSYVISLQLGRAIKKEWEKYALNNTWREEDVLPALAYLRRAKQSTTYQKRASQGKEIDWHDRTAQLDVLEERASMLARDFMEAEKQGKDTSFQVLELTMGHTDLHYVKGLCASIENAPDQSKSALQALANLYIFSTLSNGLATFAGSQYLTQADVKSLKAAFEKSIGGFEPYLYTILEAFSFTPWETKSTLCPVDKTPYEAIVDWAKGSELGDNTFMRPAIMEIRSIWKKQEQSRI